MRKGDKVKLTKQNNETGEVELIHYSKNSSKPYKVTVILDSQYGGFVKTCFIGDVEVI